MQVQEVVDIVRFLTKQNVHHGVQNEILKYCQLIKQKHWLLYITSNEDIPKDYVYYEIIPYVPIDQIKLINLYKFLYESNSKLYKQIPKRKRLPHKMTHYNESGYTYVQDGGPIGKITTEELMLALMESRFLNLDELNIPIYEHIDYTWWVYLNKIEI